MKRPLIHLLSGAALAFGFSFTALAENITYPPAPLQTIAGVAQSLAPAGSGSGRSNSLSGNNVTVNSGTVDGDVYGAVNINGPEAASNNRVIIRGGVVTGGIDGAQATTVTDSSVTISGGWAHQSVFGGHAWSYTGMPTAAVGNSVIITGGTVVPLYVYGGIYGGYAKGGASTATVTGNSVTISGGTVDGYIYGGVAENNDGDATATHNTITIQGAPVFGSSVTLQGGHPATGNTLNLHTAGLTVTGLYYFQTMNFYLPTTLAAGGTMLTVTDPADITGMTFSVALEGAGHALKTGDRFVLIRGITGNLSPTSGVIGGYAYTAVKDGNNLVLVIGNAQQAGPTREYSGQWIKADENAWGLTVLMSFPNNPRYIFVPWYTYDRSGKASWYIFQGDNWSANDTISAEVRRYTGPNWGVMPYDNNSVGYAVVGTAKLTFTSATTATFQYNVEGAERTIALDRLDGAPSAASGSYTGQWIKIDEDAWGLTVLNNFPSNPNYVFAPWYTYDKDGKASWYLFQGEKAYRFGSNNEQWELNADVHRYTGSPWGIMPYDNNRVADTKAGTAKLTFTSPTTAQFEYNVEGASRTIDLVKLQ